MGIRLPMRGARVRALVREDPTFRGAAEPGCHSYRACAATRETPRSNKDPTQPKINKLIKKKKKSSMEKVGFEKGVGA